MQIEMAQKLASLSSEHSAELDELKKKFGVELEESQ